MSLGGHKRPPERLIQKPIVSQNFQGSNRYEYGKLDNGNFTYQEPHQFALKRLREVQLP
jgi:hypothetical protein